MLGRARTAIFKAYTTPTTSPPHHGHSTTTTTGVSNHSTAPVSADLLFRPGQPTIDIKEVLPPQVSRHHDMLLSH